MGTNVQPGLSLVRLSKELDRSDKWQKPEWELFRQAVCEKATDRDLQLLALYSTQTGLCPFRKQIYLVIRGGKPTIQTGIDGFIQIAQDTGEYEGLAGTFWCGPEKVWTDVWDSERDGAPMAAKVGVWRKGFREATWMVANFNSYYPESKKERFMWDRMPERMIAKCATALALRTAFQALSGIYTDDEMMQAGPSDFDVQIKDEAEVSSQQSQRTQTSSSTQKRPPVNDNDKKEARKQERVKYLLAVAAKKWPDLNSVQVNAILQKFANKRELLALDPQTKQRSLKASSLEQVEALIKALSQWQPPAPEEDDVEDADYTLPRETALAQIERCEAHLSKLEGESRGDWRRAQLARAIEAAPKEWPGVTLKTVYGRLDSNEPWTDEQLTRWTRRLERLIAEEVPL